MARKVQSKVFGSTSTSGPVTRVKTEGRIGSPTPKSYLSGGLSLDTNASAQSHGKGLGKAAPTHLSPGHKGNVWSDRVAKARELAKTPRNRTGIEPINHASPALKRVKP